MLYLFVRKKKQLLNLFNKNFPLLYPNGNINFESSTISASLSTHIEAEIFRVYKFAILLFSNFLTLPAQF